MALAQRPSTAFSALDHRPSTPAAQPYTPYHAASRPASAASSLYDQPSGTVSPPHQANPASKFRCRVSRTPGKPRFGGRPAATVMPDGSRFDPDKQVHFDDSLAPSREWSYPNSKWDALAGTKQPLCFIVPTAGYAGHIPCQWEHDGVSKAKIVQFTSPDRAERVGYTTMAKLADLGRLPTPDRPPERQGDRPRHRPASMYSPTRPHNHASTVPAHRVSPAWPLSAVATRAVPTPSQDSGWKNHEVHPTHGIEWSKKPAEVICGADRPWTASELESLIRDKIRMKTTGSNGRAFEAISLFEREGDANEIEPEAWHKGIKALANKDVTWEESMSLFNKYDADGGGSIDIFEFIEAMLPPDFPKRTVDTEYTQKLQTDRATRHANNIPKMLRTPPQTKSKYEGPKVEIPPGYGGHVPGFCERFGVSYGDNALTSLTHPRKIVPGDFREVSSRGKDVAKGAFPGHMIRVIRGNTPPASAWR